MLQIIIKMGQLTVDLLANVKVFSYIDLDATNNNKNGTS